MKKLLALLLVLLLMGGAALAEDGAELDWAAYDALIASIKAEADPAAREALMHEAEAMLMDTGAVVPITYYTDPYMMKTGVEGVYGTIEGFKYFMYATYEGADTLRINLASEPDRLDPALLYTVDGACLAVNSFAGLYTHAADGTLQPELATGYTVSDDGLTYTFTLREGLTWSDGEPLTAEDFVYSWQRAADPANGAVYSYLYSIIAGYGTDAGLAVSASEDGLSFTVELVAPCPYILDLAAFPAFYPVPQHCVEAAEGYLNEDGSLLDSGAWATEAGFVTSGAYTLESWTHDESMVYVKNPNYWNAQSVTMERLEFMLSADDATIYAAYRAGDLDFIDTVPADEMPALLESGDPEFYVADNLGTYFLCFNVNSPMFEGMTDAQAANVRKAISMLIDRTWISETVRLTEPPANTFVPAAMADGNGGIFRQNDDAYTYPDAEDVGYMSLTSDVEGAIALLEEAGYTFEGGVLSAETPLSFEYLVNPGTQHEGVAQLIQEDLAVVGIEMTIRSVEWNVLPGEMMAGNFDVGRLGMNADFNDPICFLEMFTTASGNNFCQLGR